jgi:hypothetical protein
MMRMFPASAARRAACLAAACLAACLQEPSAPPRASGSAVPGGQTAILVPVSSVPGGTTEPAVSLLRAADDAPSHGGTVTFTGLGAAGWYPSRRDPASGQCDAYKNGQCCMAKHALADAGVSPWDEELILTLRGPMLIRQIAVYAAADPEAAAWDRVSFWDQAGSAPQGIAFQGDAAPGGAFAGSVGNKCLVDVSSDRKFACGPGSVPYCDANSPSQRYGWQGSKLILIQASMPHFGDAALAGVKHCSEDPADHWFDAPWMGLSHGELIRAGKFGGCNCYAKDPAKWQLADGCGQFNVFETVNDNNAYRNLELFSTNFFSYAGYVGEGPCGKGCDNAKLTPAIDLIDKATSGEAQPALATPKKGPGAAFRRPANGYRWFLILVDAKTRAVQLAIAHPGNLPAPLSAVTAPPPAQVPRGTIDALLALRLPAPIGTGIRRP